MNLGNILADDVRVDLVFDYVGQGGRATRTVIVDALFGPTFECPTHIRGRCSIAGERRAFRLDRVAFLHLPDGSFGDRIAWRVGNHIAKLSGRETSRPECVWPAIRKASLEVSQSGEVTRLIGEVGPAWLEYRPWGAVIRLSVAGRPAGGGRLRRFQLKLGGGMLGGRDLTWLTDHATGEEVDDLVEWLDRINVEHAV